jgi:CheY-like chemotaxis protein
MEAAYTVALVGFAQHESATFESFFRLAARRPPAYRVQEEVLDAQLLLVNADNAQAVALVRDATLPGRVLLIGAHDAGTGWPVERKPVRLVSLLGSLDALVGLRTARAAAATAAPLSPAVAATEAFKASQLHGLQASMRLASGKPQPIAPLPPSARARRRSPETEFPPTRPMTREEALAMIARAAGMVVEPDASVNAGQDAAQATPAGHPATPRPSVALSPARPSEAPAPAHVSPTTTTATARAGTVNIPLHGATDFADLEDLLNVAPPAPRARSSRLPSRLRQGDAAVPEVARGDALLVGQSLVEGRILLKRFRKYELSMDWCREPAQVQAMLKAHPYRLVVIDRLSGEPDAFQVCRWAKQAKGPKGAATVILFAPSAGSMERMKAGLAGADAYLSRSVSEADLYKVLAQHRLVSLNGFAPTNVGSF